MSSILSFAARRTTGAALLLSLIASVALSSAASAVDPSILTGAVTSPNGEKMGGVTVSAKAVGSTITTTVFTDEAGAYYFPLLPPGKYRVWAQALGFETANGEAELKTGARADFSLKKIEDALERDYFLTAEAARDFGLVDKVIDKRPEELSPKPA